MSEEERERTDAEENAEKAEQREEPEQKEPETAETPATESTVTGEDSGAEKDTLTEETAAWKAAQEPEREQKEQRTQEGEDKQKEEKKQEKEEKQEEQEDPDGAVMKEQIGEMAAVFMQQEIGGTADRRRGDRRDRRRTIRRAEDRRAEDRRNGRSVITYILLLFTAALLLMGLSSLMHQRTTLGAIGEIQSDLDAMQEVQNFQEKIISLQEARQELEDQLKAMQSDMNGLLSQAQEERGRTEAMRYLYRIQMQYGAGRYQACQVLIDEFESAGLVDSLPTESEDNGVPSPLERFREIKADNTVQVTEAMAPQTGVVVQEWTPALPEEEETAEETVEETTEAEPAVGEETGV